MFVCKVINKYTFLNVILNNKVKKRFILTDLNAPKVLKEAVKLADILIVKRKAARSLLNYNRKTSTRFVPFP